MPKNSKSSRKKTRHKETRKTLDKIQRRLVRIDEKLDALIEHLGMSGDPEADESAPEADEESVDSSAIPGGAVTEISH